MRLQATWLLATLGAITSASTTGGNNNILEVDLVFPQNKTYTPATWFPIVFAFQGSPRAQYLNFEITYHLRALDNQANSITRSHDLRFANWTSHDPYFAHEFFSLFDSPGRWNLAWTLTWQSCNEDGFEKRPMTSDMVRNMTSFSTWFTVQDTAESVDVDLVSATSETSCPDPNGDTAIAINVTDKTMPVPSWVQWSGGKYTNSTCAVVAPTPTIPDPCKVDIDRTVVEGMQASLKARRCRGLNPPDDCLEDDEESSAQSQRGALLGVLGLLTLSGALGYFAVT